MAVLVFADNTNGSIAKSSKEAINYAHQMGQGVTVVTYGEISQDKLSALGNSGANKVLHHTGVNRVEPSQLSKMVAEAAKAESAEIVVFAHDYTGKSVAPLTAVRLNAGIVSGAVALPDTSSGFRVRKAVFSGKAFANYELKSDVKVISLLPNSIDLVEVSGSASVENFSADLGSAGLVQKEVRGTVSEGGPVLTEAELVVSAGRGLKGPENWGMVEELAELLGAATACSRPVADVGWRPHHEHVGQTGVAIRPNLYIAIGISGAIQHLAGVNGSKVIVVINKDPEAPFFKAADYGIVGDAFEVVPKLIEAVKKLKAA
ncbi:electron transfer flavoprotein subunit alpha/FixB family protein [Salibacteraceae bacterium]|jgi:electron transfer flavoprotein alpha subunit|nr:electron transfer flavoprotein subunit alpha/FixB family protein [Salibacteraceae bacterium]